MRDNVEITKLKCISRESSTQNLQCGANQTDVKNLQEKLFALVTITEMIVNI